MASRMRILCVGKNLDVVTEALRGAGYDVKLASTPAAALAIFRLFPPDAIVLQSKDTEHLIPRICSTCPRIPVVISPAESPAAHCTDLLQKIGVLVHGNSQSLAS